MDANIKAQLDRIERAVTSGDIATANQVWGELDQAGLSAPDEPRLALYCKVPKSIVEDEAAFGTWVDTYAARLKAQRPEMLAAQS